MVTIGTLKDSDNLNTIKEKCASAFHLSVPMEQLVLVRAGAKIDDSAFTSLGEFLSCLSAQQSKISFGIGFEVCVQVIQIYTYMTHFLPGILSTRKCHLPHLPCPDLPGLKQQYPPQSMEGIHI